MVLWPQVYAYGPSWNENERGRCWENYGHHALYDTKYGAQMTALRKIVEDISGADMMGDARRPGVAGDVQSAAAAEEVVYV